MNALRSFLENPVAVLGTATLVLVIALAGVRPVTADENKPYSKSVEGQFDFYTANSAGGDFPADDPETSFACEDTVFAVIKTTDSPRQKLKMVVTWTDPLGKERERSTFDFHTRPGTSRTWSWLKLHRGAGATVMSMFDSSAGLGEFIGEWTVEVAINGKRQKELTFSVLC